MSSLLTRTATAALCALAISTAAAAQAPVQADSIDAPAPAETRNLATIMARQSVESNVVARSERPELASVVRRREAFDRSTTLMIVGAGLIITGLVVGGDASTILYLAGAGIGGYGVYLYLQRPDARMRAR